ncbi:MAG: hypothetical protein FJ288_04915 [Planctomycetes bacterium]|nr:hypothetical protein [Planctomycetota bacterium]
MEPLRHLVQIAYTVIGPIVVLAGAGYLIGRRVPAAAEVLAKILLYLLIPVYVFYNILTSDLRAADYGAVVAFSAAALGVLYLAARALSALRRHDPPLRGAFANTAILYNSANFSIPVMALAFGADAAQAAYAVAVQAVVAACQGFAAYTVGAFIAAAGSGPVRHAMVKVLRLPFIYALLAALALKQFGVDGAALERVTILSKPITIICGAYVPMALMTLGAQMACVSLIRAPVDLALALAARLALGPLLGLALVTILGLEGLLAQVLIIGVSAPSAVASVVVAIEYKNRPDFAASAVFISTLGAGLTVPLVIFLVRTLL